MLGYDLWALCQDGPEADLGATERTQPAMLAAGVATWRVWIGRGGPRPVAMAGHSLGEYTALVCSEALDFRTAIDLVRYPRPGDAAGRAAGAGRDGGDPRASTTPISTRPAAKRRRAKWSSPSISMRPARR